MSLIYTQSFAAPAVNRQEIFRYAGCQTPDDRLAALVEAGLNECADALSYKVCYAEFPIQVCGKRVEFPFMTVQSAGLAKNLSPCNSVIVFAATVGIGLDRLITKYSRLSPSKALVLQAIGAERIESLCDVFNQTMRCRYESADKSLRPRFSPGYGDFALQHQTDIFRTLDCPRKIGLTLGANLLMSPSKSVTAVIGISDKKAVCHDDASCPSCGKTDCDFRR